MLGTGDSGELLPLWYLQPGGRDKEMTVVYHAGNRVLGWRIITMRSFLRYSG